MPQFTSTQSIVFKQFFNVCIIHSKDVELVHLKDERNPSCHVLCGHVKEAPFALLLYPG